MPRQSADMGCVCRTSRHECWPPRATRSKVWISPFKSAHSSCGGMSCDTFGSMMSNQISRLRAHTTSTLAAGMNAGDLIVMGIREESPWLPLVRRRACWA